MPMKNIMRLGLVLFSLLLPSLVLGAEVEPQFKADIYSSTIATGNQMISYAFDLITEILNGTFRDTLFKVALKVLILCTIWGLIGPIYQFLAGNFKAAMQGGVKTLLAAFIGYTVMNGSYTLELFKMFQKLGSWAVSTSYDGSGAMVNMYMSYAEKVAPGGGLPTDSSGKVNCGDIIATPNRVLRPVLIDNQSVITRDQVTCVVETVTELRAKGPSNPLANQADGFFKSLGEAMAPGKALDIALWNQTYISSRGFARMQLEDGIQALSCAQKAGLYSEVEEYNESKNSLGSSVVAKVIPNPFEIITEPVSKIKNFITNTQYSICAHTSGDLKESGILYPVRVGFQYALMTIASWLALAFVFVFLFLAAAPIITAPVIIVFYSMLWCTAPLNEGGQIKTLADMFLTKLAPLALTAAAAVLIANFVIPLATTLPLKIFDKLDIREPLFYLGVTGVLLIIVSYFGWRMLKKSFALATAITSKALGTILNMASGFMSGIVMSVAGTAVSAAIGPIGTGIVSTASKYLGGALKLLPVAKQGTKNFVQGAKSGVGKITNAVASTIRRDAYPISGTAMSGISESFNASSSPVLSSASSTPAVRSDAPSSQGNMAAISTSSSAGMVGSEAATASPSSTSVRMLVPSQTSGGTFPAGMDYDRAKEAFDALPSVANVDNEIAILDRSRKAIEKRKASAPTQDEKLPLEIEQSQVERKIKEQQAMKRNILESARKLEGKRREAEREKKIAKSILSTVAIHPQSQSAEGSPLPLSADSRSDVGGTIPENQRDEVSMQIGAAQVGTSRPSRSGSSVVAESMGGPTIESNSGAPGFLPLPNQTKAPVSSLNSTSLVNPGASESPADEVPVQLGAKNVGSSGMSIDAGVSDSDSVQKAVDTTSTGRPSANASESVAISPKSEPTNNRTDSDITEMKSKLQSQIDSSRGKTDTNASKLAKESASKLKQKLARPMLELGAVESGSFRKLLTAPSRALVKDSGGNIVKNTSGQDRRVWRELGRSSLSSFFKTVGEMSGQSQEIEQMKQDAKSAYSKDWLNTNLPNDKQSARDQAIKDKDEAQKTIYQQYQDKIEVRSSTAKKLAEAVKDGEASFVAMTAVQEKRERGMDALARVNKRRSDIAAKLSAASDSANRAQLQMDLETIDSIVIEKTKFIASTDTEIQSLIAESETKSHWIEVFTNDIAETDREISDIIDDFEKKSRSDSNSNKKA